MNALLIVLTIIGLTTDYSQRIVTADLSGGVMPIADCEKAAQNLNKGFYNNTDPAEKMKAAACVPQVDVDVASPGAPDGQTPATN